jgi:hypothetical protein
VTQVDRVEQEVPPRATPVGPAVRGQPEEEAVPVVQVPMVQQTTAPTVVPVGLASK